jgi:hypothetical protein
MFSRPKTQEITFDRMKYIGAVTIDNSAVAKLLNSSAMEAGIAGALTGLVGNSPNTHGTIVVCNIGGQLELRTIGYSGAYDIAAPADRGVNGTTLANLAKTASGKTFIRRSNLDNPVQGTEADFEDSIRTGGMDTIAAQGSTVTVRLADGRYYNETHTVDLDLDGIFTQGTQRPAPGQMVAIQFARTVNPTADNG